MAGNAINTRVLMGGYRLSSQTNSITISTTAATQDVTAFEDTGKQYIVLPPESSIEINGYLTANADDTGTWEKMATDALTTADTIARVFSESSTFTGQPADVLPGATTTNLQLNFPVAGVMTISGTFNSSTGLRHGICVYSGTVSATGETTPVDIGAAGSAGGVAYLFVTTETGTGTSAEIDIESATTSGGTYASEGTFTFSGIGVVAVALSGTVNRHLRINVTDLGGATSWFVTCIACVSGVTYN